MRRMLVPLGMLLLLGMACHSVTRQEWRSPAMSGSARPVLVGIVPPGNGLADTSAWSTVLEQVIGELGHMSLVSGGWTYALWLSVDQENLSLTVRDARGRIQALVNIRDTRFSDRQTGRAMPGSTAATVRSVRTLLLELFPATVTNQGAGAAAGGGS